MGKLVIVLLCSCLCMVSALFDDTDDMVESNMTIHSPMWTLGSVFSKLLSYKNDLLLYIVITMVFSIICYRLAQSPLEQSRACLLEPYRIETGSITTAQEYEEQAGELVIQGQRKNAANHYSLAAIHYTGLGDAKKASAMHLLAGDQYVLIAKTSAADDDHADAAYRYECAVEQYTAGGDHKKTAENWPLAEKHYLLAGEESAAQGNPVWASEYYLKAAECFKARGDIQSAIAVKSLIGAAYKLAAHWTARKGRRVIAAVYFLRAAEWYAAGNAANDAAVMSLLAGDQLILLAKKHVCKGHHADAALRYDEAVRCYEAGGDPVKTEKARKAAKRIRKALSIPL